MAVKATVTVYAGALLQAATLLTMWLLGLLALSLIAIAVITTLRKNRRKAVILVVPFVVAMMRTVISLKPVWMVGIAVLVLGRGLGHGGVIEIPPEALPQATVYGEYLFCLAFVLFALMVLPRSYGLSLPQAVQQTQPGDSFLLKSVRVNGLLLLGMLLQDYRGPHCLYFGSLTITFGLILSWLTLRAVGVARFQAAPQAAALNTHKAGEMAFLQISDIHITDRDNRVPTGGGRAGLGELKGITRNIDQGVIRVPLVLVSGDVADHGSESEWARAMEPLRLMKKKARVVLAPGNHDVLPSYTPFGLLSAALHPGGSTPMVDGTLVRRYLERAAQLEPELTTCDGEPVKKLLDRIEAPWLQLETAWNAARDEAITALGLPAGTRHAAALSRYRSAQPTLAANLEARFIAIARQAYPDIGANYWQTNLYIISPTTPDLREIFVDGPWNKRWYDPYPLRLKLEDQGVEVLIANSNPPQPLLVQSALGLCGESQLQRLEKLLIESSARTVVVMHHHALVHWQEDAFDLARWGTLAHDTVEGRKLIEMLSRSANDARQVFLLTGHVHLRSRFAFITPEGATLGPAHGFWYCESGALGESGGRDLIAAVRDDSGNTFKITPSLENGVAAVS